MNFLLRLWYRIVFTYFKIKFWHYREHKSEIHPLEMSLILRTTRGSVNLIKSTKLHNRRYGISFQWSLGRTAQEIADHYGITRERVRQCVWKTYHDYRSGELKKIAAMARER